MSSASCATCAISSGRVASSLRTIWRARCVAAIASVRAMSCCKRIELGAQRLHQRADLRRRLGGEALLEAFERDQAVAVAVLVAGLARARSCWACSSAGSTGASASLAAGPGATPAETSPGAQAANELSSSRGMKRA